MSEHSLSKDDALIRWHFRSTCHVMGAYCEHTSLSREVPVVEPVYLVTSVPMSREASTTMKTCPCTPTAAAMSCAPRVAKASAERLQKTPSEKGVWYWSTVPQAPAAEWGQWTSYVSPTSMPTQCSHAYSFVNLASSAS